MVSGRELPAGSWPGDLLGEIGATPTTELRRSGPLLGAVIHAALLVAAEMDEGDVVVLLADVGWKYLSTGIFDRDPDELEDELGRSLLW